MRKPAVSRKKRCRPCASPAVRASMHTMPCHVMSSCAILCCGKTPSNLQPLFSRRTIIKSLCIRVSTGSYRLLVCLSRRGQNSGRGSDSSSGSCGSAGGQELCPVQRPFCRHPDSRMPLLSHGNRKRTDMPRNSKEGLCNRGVRRCMKRSRQHSCASIALRS